MLWTNEAQPSESTTFWPLWWHVSLSIRVQTTLNHISICFLPQYQRQRKCFFQSASWKRNCTTRASSVVWTLIDNGKLANRIARLVAIVVKQELYKVVSLNAMLTVCGKCHMKSGHTRRNCTEEKECQSALLCGQMDEHPLEKATTLRSTSSSTSGTEEKQAEGAAAEEPMGLTCVYKK